MLKPDAQLWREHRFFADAPRLLDRAAEIDNLLSSFGPLARIGSQNDLLPVLRTLFGKQIPEWPELDQWAENIDTDDEKRMLEEPYSFANLVVAGKDLLEGALHRRLQCGLHLCFKFSPEVSKTKNVFRAFHFDGVK